MLTIFDIAKAKGAEQVNGGINGGEFTRLGLPMIGGCVVCHATIAAYNSYPTTTGYLMCRDCVTEEVAFTTVEDFDRDG
jgi:hypothetical protein